MDFGKKEKELGGLIKKNKKNEKPKI